MQSSKMKKVSNTDVQTELEIKSYNILSDHKPGLLLYANTIGDVSYSCPTRQGSCIYTGVNSPT